MPTFTCAQCSRPVHATPEGRLPPWCPHCGAAVKTNPAPDAPRPTAAPAAPLGRVGIVPMVDAAPTEAFFHVCVPAYSENDHRLYRIYVTRQDLLFFAIGVGPVSMGEVLPRTRSSMVGPRVGLAGAIAELADARQRHLAQRIAELDASNESMLRASAEARDRGFVIGPDDVDWMTVSGASFWYGWICSVQHEAVWKFKHRSEGRWKLALPALRDARRAVECSRRLFGDRVEVNLSWGRG
ncbi:hypothetical protein AYO40_01880 [Planctomycetaceae bacterium SCGC AG-212-D15]|nr:hypothetical protein AYO40_01880 [Planctomycetaceae bacterium SCGC AG-212-D15]